MTALDGPDIDELRQRYVAIGCTVRPGTDAARKLGEGSRILFVISSDGNDLQVFDTVGNKHIFAIKSLRLDGIYNSKGKRCPHKIDLESGYLLAFVREYVDSDGESVEEWMECFPWENYVPEAACASAATLAEAFGGCVESGLGSLSAGQ